MTSEHIHPSICVPIFVIATPMNELSTPILIPLNLPKAIHKLFLFEGVLSLHLFDVRPDELGRSFLPHLCSTDLFLFVVLSGVLVTHQMLAHLCSSPARPKVATGGSVSDINWMQT